MDPSHTKRYTEHDIECRVVDLLNEAYSAGVTVPIDVDLLVERNPHVDDIIPAKLEEPFGVAAVLVFKPDIRKFDIFVDENTRHGRANFSVAHEFGHAVLHGELCRDCVNLADAIDLHRRIRRSHSRIEAEADKFASFLLMPRKQVHIHAAAIYEHLVREHGCDGAAVQSKLCPALANFYKVSRVAMAIRLERLGLQRKISAAIEHKLLTLDI